LSGNFQDKRNLRFHI